MSATVRVYVNGAGVDAPADGTALDAVRMTDPALAGEIVSGARRITDSRGLPIDSDVPVYGGAIYRIVTNRQRSGAGDGA